MDPASRNQAAHALEEFQTARARERTPSVFDGESVLWPARRITASEPTNLTSRIKAAFRRQRLGAW